MKTEKPDNNDTEATEEDPDPFLKIMEQVGSNGHFQKIYKWIFVMGLSVFGSMIYMNIFLALDEPEHWCNVPGRERTNFTLDEWRDLTLPKERDNRNVMTFSKCKMYDLNFTELANISSDQFNSSLAEIKECSYNFSYDKTWYEKTITSQEDWICEKELYVTNTFVVDGISEVVGALFLGQLGDMCGRRFVYYIGVVLSTLGRFLNTYTSSSFLMFLITASLAALTVSSLFLSPILIAMEMSGEDERSNIAMCQSFGWYVGTTFMAFVFWWVRDWVPFIWLTTLPTLLVLIFYKYTIESPRWLISKRRYADALVQLKTIAHINGRTFTTSASELADLYGNVDEENVMGAASLFMGWRIAKNTIIMGFSWCILAISYFTLVLFSSRMGGNPFFNFAVQNIVEMPACIVGKYLGDKYGRRLTNSVSYLICFIACFPVIMLSQNIEYGYLMTIMAAFIRFVTASIAFLLSLQSFEIYPTCLRQTGIAVGRLLYNAIGVLAPYLVHLGTKNDIRYPYIILGVLFLIGFISGSFLPETLHYRLPDTLEDAKVFGKNQKFFSLPKPNSNPSSEEIKLNQSKYKP